jgi:SAM-dependent methyltransferase
MEKIFLRTFAFRYWLRNRRTGFLSLLSEHNLLDFNLVVGVDLDIKALDFARKIIPLLWGEKSKTEFKFYFNDITKEDWQIPKPGLFETAIVCYIWSWVGNKLDQVMQNLVKALSSGGHLIIIGEFPDRATKSPF